MALFYVREGIVALAADNPATGETADPICPNFDVLAMNSMWAGRHYEGISAFQKLRMLEWLKQHPAVDAKRIAVSGHSLGAKPALIIGLLEPTVRAVVWNEAIVNWRKRAVATNLLNIGLWQYIPAFLEWFDYPDLMAALAPRPFLVTEGGRTRDIQHVLSAYHLIGADRQIKVVHYPKYAAPDRRPLDNVDLPEGLTMDQYFAYANVDPPEHYFKANLAVPWLRNVLGRGRQGSSAPRGSRD
jgi:hypothetical protein